MIAWPATTAPSMTSTVSATQADFFSLVTANQGIIHKVCRLYCDSPEDRRDLFALTQRMIHPAAAAVGAAGVEGHRWALAMAGMRQSAPEPRDTLFATAISAPVGTGAHRSLFAVARLAVAIAARGGMRSPAREQWLVLRTGLFGAMGLR